MLTAGQAQRGGQHAIAAAGKAAMLKVHMVVRRHMSSDHSMHADNRRPTVRDREGGREGGRGPRKDGVGGEREGGG